MCALGEMSQQTCEQKHGDLSDFNGEKPSDNPLDVGVPEGTKKPHMVD
jgi:hypothetical protein